MDDPYDLGRFVAAQDMGGTFERDASNPEPEAATTERILRENGELFGKMRV